MSPPPSPPLSGRRWWQRRITDPVARQLTQGVEPGKIALTLAVGSAFALFPVLGTTTLLCLLAGLFLGLNQPIIQAVNIACNVIWIPALVGFIRLGDRFAGSRSAGLDLPRMLALFHRDPAEFFRRFGVTGIHAVIGWSVVMVVWIPLIYAVARPVLRAAARARRTEPARA
jgi:uncharacterized protein (DUF2062 family)